MLQEYEWGLAQYLGAGVAACYRGYRVYDTDRTKDLVKKYVEFYKVSYDAFKKMDLRCIQCHMTLMKQKDAHATDPLL